MNVWEDARVVRGMRAQLEMRRKRLERHPSLPSIRLAPGGCDRNRHRRHRKCVPRPKASSAIVYQRIYCVALDATCDRD